jgi:hypothetical protein
MYLSCLLLIRFFFIFFYPQVEIDLTPFCKHKTNKYVKTYSPPSDEEFYYIL